MTVWEQVGRSHFGDRAGIMQYGQVYAARRIKRLIDLVAQEPGCRRMTVNEGRRTRARQDYLYDLHIHHGGVLAAVPYTSRHDEVTHGNAFDLGGPNGEVLNAAEQAAIRKWADVVGILYTGPSFGELWHVEALTSPYTYVSTAPASSSTAPLDLIKGDNPMIVVFNKARGFYYLLGINYVRHLAKADAELMSKVVSEADEIHSLDTDQIVTVFGALNIPAQYIDPAKTPDRVWSR